MAELVRSGRTPKVRARDFEPSTQVIRNWVRQPDLAEERGKDGLTSSDEAEPTRCIVSSRGVDRPPSPSASAASKRMSSPPWGRSVTASTTPSVRASSPPASASSSIAGPSRPDVRPPSPSSTASRAGTTPGASTPPPATSPRTAMKGETSIHRPTTQVLTCILNRGNSNTWGGAPGVGAAFSLLYSSASGFRNL